MSRRGSRVVAGGLALAIVLVTIIASTQITGCCGGSSTHGCKFVDSPDAAADAGVADAPLNCPFAPCASGTACCFEPDNTAQPLRCIATGTACMGPTGNCRGDRDCPAGADLHCCGNVEDLSTQCQTQCSGHIDIDHSARICLGNDECPTDLPACKAFSVEGRTFFACATQ